VDHEFGAARKKQPQLSAVKSRWGCLSGLWGGKGSHQMLEREGIAKGEGDHW